MPGDRRMAPRMSRIRDSLYQYTVHYEYSGVPDLGQPAEAPGSIVIYDVPYPGHPRDHVVIPGYSTLRIDARRRARGRGRGRGRGEDEENGDGDETMMTGGGSRDLRDVARIV